MRPGSASFLPFLWGLPSVAPFTPSQARGPRDRSSPGLPCCRRVSSHSYVRIMLQLEPVEMIKLSAPFTPWDIHTFPWAWGPSSWVLSCSFALGGWVGMVPGGDISVCLLQATGLSGSVCC